jgi:MFS family permease
VDAAWVSQEWTVGRAIRTWRFRLLFTTFVLTGFGVHQTHTHQVAYLIGNDYDPLLAAMVMGAIGLISLLGKIVVGTGSDWLGREVTMALGLGAGASAMLLLISFAGGGSPAVLLFAYAALFALGYSVTAPLSPAITSDLFYGRHYGAIYGVMNVSGGLGGAIGTWLAGVIFDRTGSYQGAWLLVMAAFLTAALLGWIVAPRKVLRTPGQARRAEAARQRDEPRLAPAHAPAQPATGPSRPGAQPPASPDSAPTQRAAGHPLPTARPPGPLAHSPGATPPSGRPDPHTARPDR